MKPSFSSRLFYLGLAAMLALTVMAAVFYRERALFLDVAFQTFLMIKEGSVQVMVYRFGAAVVQALPLAVIKTGGPLWLVSLAYSMAFPLLYLGFYLLIARVFRNLALGLALVLLYTLQVYDGFYWATSELQQGLGFLLVFFAFVSRRPALDRWQHWLFLVPASVALAFYHPLVALPFFFVWGYFLLREPAWRQPRYLALAVLFALILWLKNRYAANWYDTMKFENFHANLTVYGPRFWEMPANRLFLENCLRYWWGFPLLLGIVSWSYLKTRSWLRLAYLWLACLGFIFLVHVGDPQAEHRFYMEVSYMPLTIFVALPFLMDVVPRWPERRLLGFLGVLIAVRLICIITHHQPYTERLQWLERKIVAARRAQPAAHLFWMPAAAAPADTLLLSWATPYESLLLTASKHPDSAAVLSILADPGSRSEALRSDSLFITDFKNHPIREVESRYWRLENGSWVELR